MNWSCASPAVNCTTRPLPASNSRILILDESTEGLDPHTEAVMMENILAWAEGRTLLLVIPKVRSLERMDQILMLSHGELVERGTHESQLTGSQSYRQLYKQQ